MSLSARARGPRRRGAPAAARCLVVLLLGAALLAALVSGGCAAPKRVLRAPASGPEAPVESPGGPPAPPGIESGDPAAGRAGGLRGGAAALALRQLGTPYHPGAEGPGSFDCSGLVRWVYREQGLELPRTVREQVAVGRPVPPEGLAPGDLLFFSIKGGAAADHVGIHVGEGAFVHAPGRGRVVRREVIDPWWRPRLVESRRP